MLITRRCAGSSPASPTVKKVAVCIKKERTALFTKHYTFKAKTLLGEALGGYEGFPIGVGVSGGADSMALMFGLQYLFPLAEQRANIHVIIVNHQLQEVTDEVSAHVADFVTELGFTAHVVPISVEGRRGEAEAREARYNVFAELQDEWGLQAILLGHTKNDQSEQVLLSLFRGSGLKSLSGMPYKRDYFIRPFLYGLTREETKRVCEENDYEYWADPQNDLTKYRRVSMRKLIYSLEKETGQSPVNSLVRTSQLACEDEEALEYYADSAYVACVSVGWDVKIVKTFPTAVRKRVFKKYLNSLPVDSESLTFDLLNRVDGFISDWHGQGTVQVNRRVSVSRVNGSLVFRVS